MRAMRLATTSRVVAMTLMLAACGGTAAGPTEPAATNEPTVAPAATASSGPAATDPPASAPAQSTEPVRGAGGVTDACTLVSADEWAATTGLDVTASAPIPMTEPFVGCLYSDAAGAVGTLSLSPDGGMWDLVWSASGMPEVAGVGDGAVWEENTAALMIRVGDRILGVTAGTGRDDLATRLEWAKALGQLAVGRM